MKTTNSVTQKLLYVLFENPEESFKTYTEIADLHPYTRNSHRIFKKLANNKRYQMWNSYGENTIAFHFPTIFIIINKIDSDFYQVLFCDDINDVILALGIFDKGKFYVRKTICGELYQNNKELMDAIVVSGIYFSNPNKLNKLKHIKNPIKPSGNKEQYLEEKIMILNFLQSNYKHPSLIVIGKN